MSIQITCHNGHLLRFKDKYAGHSGFCPHCKTPIHVPSREEVFENEVVAIVKASSPAPVSPDVLRQDPSPEDQSGVSLLGSTLPRQKVLCGQCGGIWPTAFAFCPACGTPLSALAAAGPERRRNC